MNASDYVLAPVIRPSKHACVCMCVYVSLVHTTTTSLINPWASHTHTRAWTYTRIHEEEHTYRPLNPGAITFNRIIQSNIIIIIIIIILRIYNTALQ
jgi:hypothetical protein